MSNKGLYTNGSTAISAKVDSIPLRDTDVTQPGQDSIGALVSNASEQVSRLVRSEIELAKTEVMGEVKKGAVGGGLFAAAGVIALYSTFFFFFFLAALLHLWMPWWAAFLIIFLVMLAVAGILAFVGFRKFKNVKAPERTMESVGELKNLVPGQAQKNLAEDDSALYTGGPAPTGRIPVVTDERSVTRTVPTRGGSTAVTKD
ncbi:Putative Holin-X, holin superfamily III [Corynebacterium mycetoides]|uniref:Putative Holin-X, holin superfamily III n=1 Tax=Corynebacterium mycetoides TaxID=38302 RepID=A0A1G9Q5E2_9CORY|nr:phage holin family protein [Corynebacterium mycetoides]SDM06262.1 Putative Holin-X, holin superfamily III [Corynebacterium mycetoides]